MSVVTADLIDSGFIPYQMSQMGRGLLWVHVKLHQSSSTNKNKNKNHHDNDDDDNDNKKEDDVEVLFCTTHLQSFIHHSHNGSKERAMQLQQSNKFCQNQVHSKSNNIQIAWK